MCYKSGVVILKVINLINYSLILSELIHSVIQKKFFSTGSIKAAI
jgi:hypothetical protein